MPPETRERGATLKRALDLIRLLIKKPHTKTELVEMLGCSRSSVERLFRVVEESGLHMMAERDGIYVYYSLPRERVLRRLGV